jgi:Phospholipase B/Carbohydrate binding domain
MIKLGYLIVGIFLFCFCLPLISGQEAVLLKLDNNSFEALDGKGLPLHWQLKTHAGEMKGDMQNAHSGSNSLMISHKNWTQSQLLSNPVTLKVGHLYRLSGWIKTDSAKTQPLKRYPTSVAACLTMESLPFTNHSPAVGGTTGWTKIETLFIATRSNDRVRLHLGYNGDAVGKAWFDDLKLEKEEDITAYIPMETVKWFGPAYRYDDKGWIFVHIEGKPYQRGYQYGYLVAQEIASYIDKLAYKANNDIPADGWSQMRFITDAFMLRKYEEEYLTEMKGIADGAAKAGATFNGKKLDWLDIVTLNSSIDIGQMHSAMRRTPHPLTGKSFLAAEDELNIPIREHKCSGFLANGPATPNGDIVFGQIFMWGGYTGIHWNVICDIIPEKGNRLVYHTYPGGIHSGADFYMNSAGIMMGETTVMQTPYDRTGSPQSNRIRKAAQYANSIDDAVKILKYKNNGQYTNDWLMGDAKTNETAIFLLGTKKTKLWRSSTGEFPGGTKGFFWSNNNNKDNEVRKEYIPNKDNAPYDLIFSPWNRDIAFNEFYKKYNGSFDSNTGVKIWASSPINRAHACDGKITTTEMAREMVFLAHFGKVTLREKLPEDGMRILRNSPNATPHLSLGYSIASPKFITAKLQALKKQKDRLAKKKNVCGGTDCCSAGNKAKPDLSNVKEHYTYDPRNLWFNTVYPASEKENWFISASAAYWRIIKNIPKDTSQAAKYFKDQFSFMNAQFLYTVSREGTMVPLKAQRIYDRYNHYRIPRIRGTFLLHQLRLYLGNKTFSKLMNTIHNRFKNKPFSNKQFFSIAKKVSGKSLKSFVMQWLNRDTLPAVSLNANAEKVGNKWQLKLNLKQKGTAYHFITTVTIETGKSKVCKRIEVNKNDQRFTFTLADKPRLVNFNTSSDIPIVNKDFYSFVNYFDDFHHTIFVYGTQRQIEANHTLTLKYRKFLADTFTEILPPVKKDSELMINDFKKHDLFVLGGPQDNSVAAHLIEKLGLKVGKNYFKWQGKTYGAQDDGLIAVFPNPYNKERIVYLLIPNSALQLYHMTRNVSRRTPSWAIYKGKEIIQKGYHNVKEYTLKIE